MQTRLVNLKQHLFDAKGGDFLLPRDRTYKQKLYAKLFSLLIYLDSNNRSEFQREEEYDAIVFFAAFIEYNYTLRPDDRQPRYQPLPELEELYRRLQLGDWEASTKDNEDYIAVIHCGLSILKHHQKLETPFFNADHQPILRLASRKVLDLDFQQYASAQHIQLAARYRAYVNAREQARKQCMPQLQKNLRIHQWLRASLTALCLIPGVFFLTEGLYGSWYCLKQGLGKGSAVGWFFASLLLSAISPLGALVRYITYSETIKDSKRDIEKIAIQQDRVVIRILPKVEYEKHRKFRKSLKAANPDIVAANPSILVSKPKKVVDFFTDEHGIEKAKIYMLKTQAEQRFDQYEALRKRQILGQPLAGIQTLFQSLRASKVGSRIEADAMFREQEQQAEAKSQP